MNPEIIAIIVPFAAARAQSVNELLDTFGNPAPSPFRDSLDRAAFVHFMSIVVVPARDDEEKAHLVIQVCADGRPTAALEQLVGAAPEMLMRALAAAGHTVRKDGLLEFLEARRKTFGSGLLDTAGLPFCGTPGMTVPRIRDEARLAAEIRRRLRKQKNALPGSALTKLERVRARIFENPELKWAFLSEPVPLLGEAKSTIALWPLIKSVFRDFLWPLFLFPVAAFIWSWLWRENPLDTALWHAALWLAAGLLFLGIVALTGYGLLRREEKEDAPFDVEPRREDMREILMREDAPGVAQNHFFAVSTIKPGPVRFVTLRLILWLIGEHTTRRSKPGHLDKIGTIHFAHWLQISGTDRFVFLSNYDGSWQSYLEDFIARLREGLTSVWSNTRDFPKTTNLTAGGAGDSARFKRWARRQQLPTRFWYSAYPTLTTSDIRTNAAIRHGFASVSNESDAARWLAGFGYAAPETVEVDQVQAIVFGGLSPLRFARCFVLRFPPGATARNWLRGLTHNGAISYGDLVPAGTALVIGFTRAGLEKLGLGPEAIATFPIAFQQGMPERARNLGDDPGQWQWGGLGKEPDAVLLLYSSTSPNLYAKSAQIETSLLENGIAFHGIPLQEIPLDPNGDRRLVEPFGFRDGISQPIMRGSKRQPRYEDETNVVEPGELLLGYGDNYGVVAPLPRSRGRDIGRNGSYLVVRQLSQDVNGFNAYVRDRATAFQAQGDQRVPDVPQSQLAEWIAAKMVGRWKDGTSLVRFPDGPGIKAGRAKWPDRGFRFGEEDPDGLRCPLGAHIRRANPRDSFEPGSQIQIDISNRHRILRVGRNFVPAEGANRGLLFMCVNADIERQFEFLQQTWVLGPNFHNLPNEVDPIVGSRGADETMTVPTPRGPVQLTGISPFISMLGGGYFFLPGRAAMNVLAGH